MDLEPARAGPQAVGLLDARPAPAPGDSHGGAQWAGLEDLERLDGQDLLAAGLPEGSRETEWLAAAAETLAALAERGSQLGVGVALETHDRFSSSLPVARVLKAVPDRTAGVLWDTLHPCRVGETPAESLNRLGERLLHVHVKDGRPKPEGGEIWDLRLLGEGAVPMPEILGALAARGYDGWLSVEWERYWHPALAGPEVALPQHAARLREMLASLP